MRIKLKLFIKNNPCPVEFDFKLGQVMGPISYYLNQTTIQFIVVTVDKTEKVIHRVIQDINKETVLDDIGEAVSKMYKELIS